MYSTVLSPTTRARHGAAWSFNRGRARPITETMSLEAVMARIAEIRTGLEPPAPATAAPAAGTPAMTDFASLLGQAGGQGSLGSPAATTSPAGVTGVAGVAGAPGGAGAHMVALAQAELQAGVAEQPPGSNDAPRIAEYRTATAGSGVGPWCAYFVSWLAKQAGTPVGEAGQGFGSVDALAAWAQRTGRMDDAPAPGRLVVWDEHIGLVTGVDPDGTIHTIEGNSSDRVAARSYGPGGGGALGYVAVG